MRPFASRIFAMALAFAMAAPLFAATYIIPPDADFISQADAIAIVTIQSSHSYYGDDGLIYTDYDAVVEKPLKAAPAPGSTIVITERGGSVGHLALAVSSEPTFYLGERTLMMLRRTLPRRFTSLSGELGKFSFVNDTLSRQLLIRGASEDQIFGWDLAGNEYMERPRDAERFVRYIEAIVAGENATEDYHVEEVASAPSFRTIQSHAAGNDYMTQFTISSVTHGARWPAGAEGFQTVGTQTGVANLAGSINTSRGAWNGETCSTINITASGTGSGTYGANDGQNLIFFDQPNSGPLAGSVVGQANTWASSDTNTNGADTYYTMVDCDIVIETGFTGSQFEAILGHEMGHTIGLRHSNQPGPGQTTFSTNALMNSLAPATPSLRAYDQEAVCNSYGPGVTCTPVSISGQPQNKSITQGQQANVTVTAAGTSPFTYQWYFGNVSGDTSGGAVPGQTSATLTDAPSTTKSYWVRVGGCNSSTADSNPVTVTVQASTCTPPSISTHPTGTTITLGQSAQLSVSAAGTGPLSYQWFTGNTGNTAQSVGSGNPLTFFPSQTDRYWVRVTGQCAPPADSNPATVTVTTASCPDVSIGTPQATQLQSGQYSLDITASSGSRPLTYQWFQGPVPGSGTPVGNTKQIIVPAPTAPTSYWVRVQNDCGKEAASTIVTINPCTDIPVITTEPADAAIAPGASSNLTVAFTSTTTATVTWYRGTAPDKSNQVGTGATFNTGALTTTTKFWASIVNTCGEKDTRTVTVTVGTACVAPSITNTSPSQSKNRGESATLSVTAGGTATLHYQWYEGSSGDTSKPVGFDSSAYNTGPLTTATKFWVKVTNDCGNAASSTINITVLTPKRHSVRS
jgi:hypothetical protein